VIERSFMTLALGAAVVLLLTMQGCIGQNKENQEDVRRDQPLPKAGDLIAVHNQNVEKLDRLWARTELRLQGVDQDGNDLDETAEGHFQFIRPGRVSLTVNKVGETYFCLGSNEIFYWWMDLRKPRSALMGEIAKATPKTVERFGVPVHPLDLIDLVGIMPIEAEDAEAGTLAWSADGNQAELLVQGRWGPRVFSFSSPGSKLTGVRLLDASGKIVCESRIERTERVTFRDDPSVIAEAPVRMVISIPASSMQVTIVMHDPQNRGTAMKDAAFKPDLLLKAYNIPQDMVRSLDVSARTESPNLPESSTEVGSQVGSEVGGPASQQGERGISIAMMTLLGRDAGRSVCRLILLGWMLVVAALPQTAHGQPALRSVVLPGAGGHPMAGRSGPSHGWMVVQSGANWALVHVPPRVDAEPGAQGPLSASGGSVRLVTSFTTPPVAIAAIAERVYMVIETVDRAGRVSRREVRSVTAARSGLGGLWRFDPEGDLYTHPLLPAGGQLLGLAACDGRLVALIDDSAEPNPVGPRIGVLDGNTWAWADVSEEIAAGLSSATGRGRLVPLRAGAGVCIPGLDGIVTLWEGTCEILKAEKSFVFGGGDEEEPLISQKKESSQATVRWRWTRHQYAIPDSSRADPANGTLIECAGARLWIHASPSGMVDISALGEKKSVPLATFADVTLPLSVCELEGDGRIVVVWTEIETPGSESGKELAPSSPRKSYQVREVSAATGRVLYEGPAKSMGPVSPADLRILSVVLLITMAVALILVLRPDPSDGVITLPEDTFLAEPGRRLLASLADAMIAWWVASAVWGIELGESLAPANMLGGATLLVAGTTLAVGWLLGTIGEWRGGRSLGKILAGCEVVSIDPALPLKLDGPLPRPSFWRSLKRNAIKWFLPPVAMLGLFDQQGRHRADMMARTMVVIRVEPQEGDDEGYNG
jgi:uncharacterized RDD family membrane protein YckC